jgi:hypothetical protein
MEAAGLLGSSERWYGLAWFVWRSSGSSLLAAAFLRSPMLELFNAMESLRFAKTDEAIQRSLRDLSALRAGLVGAYRQIRLNHFQ